MSFEKISYEIKENIAYVGFGVNEEKSMTVLSEQTLKELDLAIDKVKGEQNLKGLVIFSHKPDCFLAGVDVTMISSLTSEVEASEGAEKGQTIYNKIEDLKIPTVACVDGICLGGGLEMIMACKTIIASDNKKTKLGLPEVKLGILPGFGGTYRMPKRIGIPMALDLMLSGKMVDSRKALKMGLVDFVMPRERMVPLAPNYFNKKNPKLVKKGVGTVLSKAALDNFVTRKIIFKKAREQVLKMTKGFYPAPLKILEVIEDNYGKNRNRYLSVEAKAFGELFQTEQSSNLRHLFFMMDASKKQDSVAEIKEIKRGAVLGAGTMGGGIAWLFADNGQAPYMKDINPEALELGLKQSSEIFSKALKRKKIIKDEYDRKQWSIIPTLNFDGFKIVDLLVEAIVENMDLKKKVFADVENYMRDDAIITSNTSTLSVTEMASALKRPERFAGLHFFNPVNKMPLVEIIRHDKVSESTIKTLYQWCLDVGKTPIIVNDGPGFLVNRILAPFMNEAAYLLAEGVSIEALDKAILNFGMPMGACRLMDEVGIDVIVKAGKVMEKGLGKRASSNDLIKNIEAAGFLGKKNGKGFYLYNEKGRSEGLNPEVQKFLPSKTKKMDATEIQMRVFMPMINEAASVLEDNITDKASTVDLGLIFGTGFAPFRGGLLKYADSEGLDRVLKALEEFAEKVDKDRYAPNALLKKLVSENRKFYDL